MMSRSILVVIALIDLQNSLVAQAAPPPTEAPAGFDTPTLVAHPGSKSSSNGIAQPPGDTFARDQQVYETQHDVTTGLGPVFNACHVASIRTASPGTVINGGEFVVPEALGNKIIHPYSDFLLHDIETGDGIVQVGPQDTADKLRTAPLWGLRMRPRFMHDLRSLTLEDAIERHDGEAAHVTHRFRELTQSQKEELLVFLESL